MSTAPRPAFSESDDGGAGGSGQASRRHRATQRLVLGQRQHLGNLVAIGDTLLAPCQTGDRSAAVTAVDADGHIRWRHEIGEAHVTGISVHGDTAVVVSCSGTVEALGMRDGHRRWTHALVDTHRRRIMVAPTVSPCAAVVVGDVGHVVALDLDAGATRWRRDDLGSPDTLLTYGSAAATADAVVLPFGGPSCGLVCLRLTDGATVWSDERSAPWPSSSIVVVDGCDGLVLRGGLAVRGGALLDRVDLRTGALVWRCQLPGSFTTARPVVRDSHAVLVTGDGLAVSVDLDRGVIRGTHRLEGLRDGWGPFRSDGVGAPTGPVELDGRLVVTLIDGSIWDISASGAPRAVGDVEVPVTTQPSPWAGRLAVLDIAGALHLVHPADPAGRICASR